MTGSITAADVVVVAASTVVSVSTASTTASAASEITSEKSLRDNLFGTSEDGWGDFCAIGANALVVAKRQRSIDDFIVIVIAYECDLFCLLLLMISIVVLSGD